MVQLSAVPSGDDESPEGAAPSSPDFAALLGRSARGDEAAFAELYDALSPRLFGLVVRIVRDRAQAEEVTQEVFVEIWRHSARFDPSVGSPLSWMMTIAHRRAVDRVRSAEASTGRDHTYGATRDREYDSTSEQAETRLESGRGRRALEALTDTQRGAIELAYFGGYTHTEVAQLLEIPLGTAKTRIRDGLIRLRDTLGLTS